MAQAEFPPGESTDIPPEKSPAEEAIDSIFGSIGEKLDALDAVNAYAAAGRRVDCEH